MLPASLAACVPVFIATATSAWASAGASLVPSPVIATSRPAGLVLADQLELRLGRRLGEEVVDAGLGGDRGRGQRVVAGDHHRLDAHAAQLGEALLDAALDDVLQLDRRRARARRRRRPAACRPPWRCVSTVGAHARAGTCRPAPRRSASTASAAPLRIWRPSRSTPLMRVCAVNGTNVRAERVRRRARGGRTAPWPARRCCGPRASRRRARRAARRRRARRSVTPGGRDELRSPGGCRA